MLSKNEKQAIRFLHVSTDEVYGTLSAEDPPFAETNPFEPNSPYAASKASSDHLVRAQHHTYGLPVLTTNCSNNYRPFHFPEKLIPLVILNALNGKPYAEQITYVKDRPGHDRRNAIGARKIERELGQKPEETFDTGIEKTVQWYLDNPKWVEGVTSGEYRKWLGKQYGT